MKKLSIITVIFFAVVFSLQAQCGKFNAVRVKAPDGVTFESVNSTVNIGYDRIRFEVGIRTWEEKIFSISKGMDRGEGFSQKIQTDSATYEIFFLLVQGELTMSAVIQNPLAANTEVSRVYLNKCNN